MFAQGSQTRETEIHEVNLIARSNIIGESGGEGGVKQGAGREPRYFHRDRRHRFRDREIKVSARVSRCGDRKSGPGQLLKFLGTLACSTAIRQCDAGPLASCLIAISEAFLPSQTLPVVLLLNSLEDRKKISVLPSEIVTLTILQRSRLFEPEAKQAEVY